MLQRKTLRSCLEVISTNERHVRILSYLIWILRQPLGIRDPSTLLFHDLLLKGTWYEPQSQTVLKVLQCAPLILLCSLRYNLVSDELHVTSESIRTAVVQFLISRE